MSRRRLGITAMFMALSGCASHGPPLPRYAPNLSDADAIKILSDRAHAVRIMSGEGLLTLVRPNGESVRMDMAIVMQPPGRVRVRAWKFGQAVFDLTMNEAGVYLITPEGSSHAEQIKSAGVSAAQLARTWSLLNGGFFDSPPDEIVDQEAVMELHKKVDGQNMVCRVDRATLVPVQYALVDPQHQTRFTLTLDQYVMVDGIPWAKRLTAVSDSGKIGVVLRTMEINGQIGSDAFKPPRRAEKLP